MFSPSIVFHPLSVAREGLLLEVGINAHVDSITDWNRAYLGVKARTAWIYCISGSSRNLRCPWPPDIRNFAQDCRAVHGTSFTKLRNPGVLLRPRQRVSDASIDLNECDSLCCTVLWCGVSEERREKSRAKLSTGRQVCMPEALRP